MMVGTVHRWLGGYFALVEMNHSRFSLMGGVLYSLVVIRNASLIKEDAVNILRRLSVHQFRISV